LPPPGRIIYCHIETNGWLAMAGLRLALNTVLLLLAACAPTRFETPVARFAGSIATLSAALDQTVAGLGAEEAQARHEALRARGAAPALSVACGRARVTGPAGERLPACGLVAVASRAPSVSPVWTEHGAAREMLGALAVYAEGLNDLTKAEDRAATEAAVDAVAVGLSAALTLAGPQTAIAAPAVAAGIKLAGFAVAGRRTPGATCMLRRSIARGEEAWPRRPDAGRRLRGPQPARVDFGMQIGNSMSRGVAPGGRDYGAAFDRTAAQAVRVEISSGRTLAGPSRRWWPPSRAGARHRGE